MDCLQNNVTFFYLFSRVYIQAYDFFKQIEKLQNILQDTCNFICIELDLFHLYSLSYVISAI